MHRCCTVEIPVAVRVSLIRQSNVALYVSYAREVASFSATSKDSIGIVNALCLEQILVGYALISATVPCLKGFTKLFSTGGIGRSIDTRIREIEFGVDDYTNRSIESEACSDATRPRGPARLKIRPDSVKHETRVRYSPSKDDMRSSTGQQSGICMTVEWNIMERQRQQPEAV